MYTETQRTKTETMTDTEAATKHRKTGRDSPKRADTEGQERQRHSHIDRGAATDTEANTETDGETERETHVDTDVDKKDTEKETDIVPKKQTGMDRKDTETRRNTKKNRRCHSKKTWGQRHR